MSCHRLLLVDPITFRSHTYTGRQIKRISIVKERNRKEKVVRAFEKDANYVNSAVHNNNISTRRRNRTMTTMRRLSYVNFIVPFYKT